MTRRPLLKRGSRGEPVRELQTLLKASGYYQTYNLDGVYGPGTEASVLDFQEETRRLKVDGIVGPATWGALDGVLVVTPEEDIVVEPDSDLDCDDETWAAWLDLVNVVVQTPCRYAPGRGGYDPSSNEWIIRNRAGNYPSGSPMGCHGFVCSTWTNFVAAFVLRYNERYTPTGGMPALSMVMESSDELHGVPGLPGATYRGYGPHTSKIAEHIRDLPLATLYGLREQLPTFIIAGQSSRRRSYWNYHHTSVYVVDRRQEGSPLYRIAADGWRGSSGFSKTSMVYRRVDADYIAKFDSKHRLRCYSLHLDKVLDRPIRPVILE